ncbi:MAG: hypothetical protein JWR72_2450 [Flavisolibacter sp.]|jgi:hypothetical protein|nr:hypothetical protein [Flavisolibacter sp.]
MNALYKMMKGAGQKSVMCFSGVNGSEVFWKKVFRHFYIYRNGFTQLSIKFSYTKKKLYI